MSENQRPIFRASLLAVRQAAKAGLTAVTRNLAELPHEPNFDPNKWGNSKRRPND